MLVLLVVGLLFHEVLATSLYDGDDKTPLYIVLGAFIACLLLSIIICCCLCRHDRTNVVTPIDSEDEDVELLESISSNDED